MVNNNRKHISEHRRRYSMNMIYREHGKMNVSCLCDIKKNGHLGRTPFTLFLLKEVCGAGVGAHGFRIVTLKDWNSQLDAE